MNEAEQLDGGLTHEEHQEEHKRNLRDLMPAFQVAITGYANSCYTWFKHQGFWPVDQRSETVTLPMAEYIRLKKAEKIALIHSEVSEMLEGIRNGIPNGEKGCEAEEMADTLVRIFDYAGGFNVPIASAYEKKMEANFNRPFRHAKKF